MVSESEMFEKSFDHFWFFIFLVTLATVPVSFSIYYHFLCKMFTNFSPRRHVNDFKGTYFVEKINIYQIKNSFVFTSKDPRIEEFISSAAHFNSLVIFSSKFLRVFLRATFYPAIAQIIFSDIKFLMVYIFSCQLPLSFFSTLNLRNYR